jgi:hypothetical protein
MAIEQGKNFNLGLESDDIAFDLSSHERVERIRQASIYAQNAGEQYRAVLDEISRQISVLTRLKVSIKGSIKEDIDQSQQIGTLEAKALEESLEDPKSPENIVIRTALLLPKMGGSSLEKPKTFEAAHTLSEQLLNLNQTLENTDVSQQIVAFNFRPSFSEQWYENLDITYGFTKPAEGLVQEHSEELSPNLLVPVDESTLHGVHPSMYTPEWFHGGVVNYVNGSKSQSPSSFITKVHKPTIMLPTGEIYLERATPIVMYDLPDGSTAEISAKTWSKNYGEKTFIAIGKKSVARTLNGLVERCRELSDDKQIDMTAHPDTISNMKSFVVSGLRRSNQTSKQ